MVPFSYHTYNFTLLVRHTPREKELYDASMMEGGRSVNLLHVRRTRRVPKPFSVARLIKTTDGTPVSDQRTTAGGWTYIRTEGVSELIR